ncbi:MAG: SDR family oxidoreductase [Acidiferrobacteraceae bacterium]|jgi:NAD(P)-dependent dehydrogenase (short-subunit alcohol dehydrogenase family)|nr:SDR family oxidoreductase [Acidiferrobacteraceae bacterium]MBT3638742.1 SDR family oxidoreductase [Acidiferrobacteraceae bacterium]MBT3770790.1 SDR family oxidoreductase [Acidiferrobacteraceae bacterium]MBT3972895.1 SDR family oxidoreductase [Acidiferrobacteraceae bacterium]MBT4395549.1 SDR family oxidoreductase [Acidiferrobacteraceae bacterium]
MPGLRLEGKHAVVSGGAAGAGGAASEVFAREGANVVIVDIQEEAGLALVEKIREAGGKVSFVRADVSLNDEVDEAIDKANRLFDNRIDVLFNHAGTVIIKPFLETTESDWDRMMAINVKSMFLMTKAVLPSMLDQGGAIVNTSSISAVAGTPMEVLYCTSKGACHMFTRAIATEYRDDGIRCNAVCPGFIRTAHGIRELKELREYGVEVTEEDICRLQGRICEPEEVANAALFLASSEASFVNGETMFVDNGMLVRT